MVPGFWDFPPRLCLQSSTAENSSIAIKKLKCTQSPLPLMFFFALLVIRCIRRKNFELVEPSILYVLSKSLLKCYATAFRESGEVCADDVYTGTKRNGASASSLYLLISKLCFKVISFLSYTRRSSSIHV